MSMDDGVLTPMEIIESLDIDEEIMTCALDACFKTIPLFHETNNSTWLCCALYSELEQAKTKNNLAAAVASRVSLSDEKECTGNSEKQSWNMPLNKLLRAFNISAIEFFQKLMVWTRMMEHSPTYQKTIEERLRRFNITVLLVRHYKCVFQKLYVLPKSTDNESLGHYKALYKFGWLLFLVVRNELPSAKSMTTISGFELLACTLELVFMNALEVIQSPAINSEFVGMPSGWTNKNFDGCSLGNYSCLKAICQLIPELPLQGVQNMKCSFFHKAMLMLFMNQRLQGNKKNMRDMIRNGMLEMNLVSLNRSYDDFVDDICEMDERLFLSYVPCEKPKATMETNKGSSAYLNCCLWVHEAENFSEKQRINLARLLTHDKGLPKDIPDSIQSGIDGDQIKLLSIVRNNLRDMGLTFGVKGFAQLSREPLRRRFNLTSALYYNLLDKIVDAELSRNRQIKTINMLIHRPFNTALIACCLELVLHICENSELRFPWVLKCYSLDAFDFQKIIEPIVRHNNGLLSRDLINHLYAVGACCLSSLIWTKESHIWALYDNSLPSMKSAVLGAESYDKENVEPKPNSRAGLICMRKFYMLARQRLNYLCRCLSIAELGFKIIWQLLEHSVSELGSILLKQRHLDHLLICAIYLHCRVAQSTESFSNILKFYRCQPHVNRSIYRNVLLEEGKTGDIICFYNQLYAPRMAVFFNQFDLKLWKRILWPPLKEIDANIKHRIHPNHNVFVSLTNRPFMPDASIDKSPLTLTMKRAHSNSELAGKAKRPNILQRRKTYD